MSKLCFQLKVKNNNERRDYKSVPLASRESNVPLAEAPSRRKPSLEGGKSKVPLDDAVIAHFFICFNDRGFCELYGKNSNDNFEFRFEVSKNLCDLFENIFGGTGTNESLRFKYSYVIISDTVDFYNKSLEEKLNELANLEPFVKEKDIEVSEIYDHLFTMHYAKSSANFCR